MFNYEQEPAPACLLSTHHIKAGGCHNLSHTSPDVYYLQFLVLVFLKRNTPPLLLVLLNYMRLFRLLRLVRLLKVSHAWVSSPAGSTPWTLSPGTSILIESSVACLLQHSAWRLHACHPHTSSHLAGYPASLVAISSSGCRAYTDDTS